MLQKSRSTPEHTTTTRAFAMPKAIREFAMPKALRSRISGRKPACFGCSAGKKEYVFEGAVLGYVVMLVPRDVFGAFIETSETRRNLVPNLYFMCNYYPRTQ